MNDYIDPGVHVVQQPIQRVIVIEDDYQSGVMGVAYCVGKDDVTRIEACMKNGEYSNIPYLRVWSGDRCIAEFSQHRVAGVFFAKDQEDLGL